MWEKELFCWAEEQPQGPLNGLLLEGLENCQPECQGRGDFGPLGRRKSVPPRVIDQLKYPR